MTAKLIPVRLLIIVLTLLLRTYRVRGQKSSLSNRYSCNNSTTLFYAVPSIAHQSQSLGPVYLSPRQGDEKLGEIVFITYSVESLRDQRASITVGLKYAQGVMRRPTNQTTRITSNNSSNSELFCVQDSDLVVVPEVKGLSVNMEIQYDDMAYVLSIPYSFHHPISHQVSNGTFDLPISDNWFETDGVYRIAYDTELGILFTGHQTDLPPPGLDESMVLDPSSPAQKKLLHNTYYYNISAGSTIVFLVLEYNPLIELAAIYTEYGLLYTNGEERKALFSLIINTTTLPGSRIRSVQEGSFQAAFIVPAENVIGDLAVRMPNSYPPPTREQLRRRIRPSAALIVLNISIQVRSIHMPHILGLGASLGFNQSYVGSNEFSALPSTSGGQTQVSKPLAGNIAFTVGGKGEESWTRLMVNISNPEGITVLHQRDLSSSQVAKTSFASNTIVPSRAKDNRTSFQADSMILSNGFIGKEKALPRFKSSDNVIPSIFGPIVVTVFVALAALLVMVLYRYRRFARNILSYFGDIWQPQKAQIYRQ